MNYVYQTRCLRCGNLTDRIYGTASPEGYPIFTKEMETRSSMPFNYDCSNCKKDTMQMVVFYGTSLPISGRPRPYIMMMD